jgi:hypothetical protein
MEDNSAGVYYGNIPLQLPTPALYKKGNNPLTHTLYTPYSLHSSSLFYLFSLVRVVEGVESYLGGLDSLEKNC